MSAHERGIAIRLVGWKFVPAVVVEVQVLGYRIVKTLAALSCDLLLIDAHQVRHASENVRRRRYHARPHCAFFLEAVKRSRVVVKALGQELQLLPCIYAVAIAGGVKLGAQREM